MKHLSSSSVKVECEPIQTKMENRTKTARLNELMDRLNVQLALRRRKIRKPKFAQKQEQIKHASLICKLFRKSLKIKLKNNFGGKELIMDKFMVLENFLITPDEQFIDVAIIDEINFV